MSLSPWRTLHSDMVVGETYEVVTDADVVQGWMAPNGDFYPAEYQGHSYTATQIVHNNPGLAQRLLVPVKWDLDSDRRVVDKHQDIHYYNRSMLSDEKRLERLGWLHMYANGSFYAYDRLHNQNGRITEDQFFALQHLAKVKGIREYSEHMLADIREHGGDKFLADMVGDWVNPSFE